MVEVTFHVEDAHFRMVDVGGQRSERRKWIHCFQNVTGLIFFVALSEFDQKLYEDETVNRMHESIMLFAEICNCQWFKDAALILFLNKCDLFKEKIATTDLNVCFPDYDGGCDYDNAIRYIKRKFIGLNQNANKKVNILRSFCSFMYSYETSGYCGSSWCRVFCWVCIMFIL